MNNAIFNMLNRYDCQTAADYKNALKEIIQEIALLGLWRAKFFEHAAFYGGTSLRILYGLDRFSEALDFSLLRTTKNFDLSPYLKAAELELKSFGINVQIEEKKKTKDSAILSAFVKANTAQHLLLVGLSAKEQIQSHVEEKLKIKIELDTNPPLHFRTETKYLLQPIPFSVRTFEEPDLFAGKIHAILCRPWKIRVKGRDWYDLVWFVSRDVPLNLSHLEARMRQSNHYKSKQKLTLRKVRSLLQEKIHQLDLLDLKRDVLTFLKNPSAIEVWSKEFFSALIRKLQAVESSTAALH